jgi:uncharacterized protein YjdB
LSCQKIFYLKLLFMRGLILKFAALLFLATIFYACEEDEAEVNVTGVSVSPGGVSTAVGEEIQFTAVVEPSGATDASVTWSTSDESVATIAMDGLLTAVAPGIVEVMANTVEGDFTSSISTSVNATLLGSVWTLRSETKSECNESADNGTETCTTECQLIEFETDGTITFTGGRGPEGVVNYRKTNTEIVVTYEDNGEQVTETIPYSIELNEMELTFGSDEGGCNKVEVYAAN